jgi:Uncharacterized protein conserved in bacteria (DUF2087)
MTPRIETDMEPLAELAILVVKDGVAIGGLSDRQRNLALGLACRHVAAETALRESDVNAALKSALAQACRFIAVDHVELRRWLIDAGWLVRDGFGREYRRLAAAALTPELSAIAAALEGVDPTAWVDAQRAAVRTQRELRRSAWQLRTHKAV